MKWALFVFAFVVPLLVNGVFFLVRFLKRKEDIFLRCSVNTEDQFIKDLRCPQRNINMSVMDRVKTSGEDRSSAHFS